MAQITLTIPDAVVQRVIVVLCSYTGATPSAVNAKIALIKLIKDRVRSYEAQLAGETARQASETEAKADVDLNIVLT